MTLFEKWYLTILLIQTALLVAAVIVARGVGRVQNQINRQLLDLNFSVAVDLIADKHELCLVNRGRANLSVHGIRFREGEAEMLRAPEVIPPGGSNSILPTRRIVKEAFGSDRGETDLTVLFDVLVRSEDGTKFTIRCKTLVQQTMGVAFFPNVTEIVRGEWQ